MKYLPLIIITLLLAWFTGVVFSAAPKAIPLNEITLQLRDRHHFSVISFGDLQAYLDCHEVTNEQ